MSSSAFGYDLDVDALVDPSVPSGIPGGDLLLRLVDSVITGTEPLAGIHAEIIEFLGPHALVDAASVLGNFEMMNRVAEVSGILVPQQRVDRDRELIDRLGIASFVKT